MVKVCLCNICVCGRHKCPHNPHGIPNGNQPCTMSEYKDVYKEYPWTGQRKSCRPEPKPVGSGEPLDGSTTQRTDYIKHPMEKHYVHAADKYKEPVGDMDMSTNYSLQYTQKPLEKIQPIKKEDQRKVSGKFGGEPTYTSDYREWGVAPRERHTGPNNYLPPIVPFDSTTNYHSDYITHQGAARRQMIRPNETSKSLDQPIDDMTCYRDHYIKHELPRREAKEKQEWLPNPAKSEDQTNYRRDFIPKENGKQASCKPDPTPMSSDRPFVGDTTHRDDFRLWPTERRYFREPDQYKKPEGVMTGDTTTSVDYSEKPIAKVAPLRPKDGDRKLGKFDGTTNYHVEFRKHSPTERTRPMPRDGYMPNDAPFEGQPTYQRDYQPHRGVPTTRSLKPLDPGYSSNAPLNDSTEYKQEFKQKPIPVCPSDILMRGGQSDYTYVDQDETGHKWYETRG